MEMYLLGAAALVSGGFALSYTNRLDWTPSITANATPFVFLWAMGVWLSGGSVFHRVMVPFACLSIATGAALVLGERFRERRKRERK